MHPRAWIGPDSISQAALQVNSPAAAVLYRLVGEWAAPLRNAIVVDVCCGTGAIGLTLACQVSLPLVSYYKASITLFYSVKLLTI